MEGEYFLRPVADSFKVIHSEVMENLHLVRLAGLFGTYTPHTSSIFSSLYLRSSLLARAKL